MCCLRVDGLTAAKVGAEKAGQKTAWAVALEKKQAEEAAKREAELAEAHAKQAAAGDDEWDEDWDEDEEVNSARAFRYPSRLSPHAITQWDEFDPERERTIITAAACDCC